MRVKAAMSGSTPMMHLRLLALAVLGFVLQNAGASAQGHPVEIVPLIAHSSAVSCAAFSRDGTLVVTGSKDATLKLWDVATARLVRTFAGHKDDIVAVALSPDGTLAVSGSKDRTMKLWELATGRLIRTIYAHLDATGDEVSTVAFSPDGKHLLSGSRSAALAKLWDAETGRLLRVFEHSKGALRAGVSSAVFSPDGTRIATGGAGDKIVNLWDMASGKVVQAFGDYTPTFAYGVKLAFSPDGARILVADNKALTLWDAISGKLIHDLGSHEAGKSFSNLGSFGVPFIGFSADGALALMSDNGLKSWNVQNGQPVRTFQPKLSDFIAVSPDGTHALSHETVHNTLKLWDLASEQRLRTFEAHSAAVSAVAMSPVGLLLTIDSKARLWDFASGRLARSLDERSGRSAMFSSDGSRLALSSYGSVELWDIASGHSIRDMKTPSDSMAFAQDGARLLAAGRDGAIEAWDAASGEQVETFRAGSGQGDSGGAQGSATLSPDGTRLLLGPDKDRTLQVWDLTSKQLIKAFGGSTTEFLQSAAFSPDRSQLSTGHIDGALRLWEVGTGRLIRTLWHTKSVQAVVFSRDGSRLLSGSGDGTVKLWDTAAGQLIRSFEGHSSSVRSVAFSPDEKRVISGSYDTTTRIWNAETGEQLALLMTAKEGEWLAITPEGFFDASANGAEMLTVVRGLEVFGIDQFYQVLYRPDLVREKLAGDPGGKVRDAATKLDLAKLTESGRVPFVTIVSHKAEDTSPSDLVTLEAQLADQGGGIGRIEWRINGTTVGVVEKPEAAPNQTITIKQAIALDPGENDIELVAYNGANLVASVPARASITWTGTEPTTPPRLYVLAVGINEYQDAALRLTYAALDAKTLAEALKRAGQGLYQEVSVTQIIDRDATAAKLDKVFTDLAAQVRPRDVFLFFAAGHGKTLDGRYYFIPYDMRYQNDQSLPRDAIGQDRLQSWFARIPARKSVLMFDTCEAGSLTERGKTRGGLEQKAALGRLIQATGRATLTASTATQEAYEGYGGHGVFTFALLDALARADLNNNGMVELTELIQHVDGLVPAITEKRWGARQFPQMDAYGANFSLARQVAALAPAEDGGLIIPVKPTHVSSEALSVFKEAGGSGSVVEQIPPFTTVTLVKLESGWALIAKDGKVLGYAAESKLHKLN